MNLAKGRGMPNAGLGRISVALDVGWATARAPRCPRGQNRLCAVAHAEGASRRFCPPYRSSAIQRHRNLL